LNNVDEPMIACHCQQGWVCELHLHLAWPHDDCAGPGMPCENPDCPFWQHRPKPAALDTSDWKHVVRRDDPPRGGVQ
jgi:hypothetical protein